MSSVAGASGAGSNQAPQNISKEQTEAAGEKKTETVKKTDDDKGKTSTKKLKKVVGWSVTNAATESLSQGSEDLSKSNFSKKEGAAGFAGGKKAAEKDEKKVPQKGKKGSETKVHKVDQASMKHSPKGQQATTNSKIKESTDFSKQSQKELAVSNEATPNKDTSGFSQREGAARLAGGKKAAKKDEKKVPKKDKKHSEPRVHKIEPASMDHSPKGQQTTTGSKSRGSTDLGKQNQSEKEIAANHASDPDKVISNFSQKEGAAGLAGGKRAAEKDEKKTPKKSNKHSESRVHKVDPTSIAHTPKHKSPKSAPYEGSSLLQIASKLKHQGKHAHLKPSLAHKNLNPTQKLDAGSKQEKQEQSPKNPYAHLAPEAQEKIKKIKAQTIQHCSELEDVDDKFTSKLIKNAPLGIAIPKDPSNKEEQGLVSSPNTLGLHKSSLSKGHAMHHSHGVNPFSVQDTSMSDFVSLGDSKTSSSGIAKTDSGDSGSGFSIFSPKYHMYKGNSLNDETAATMASYRSQKDKNDISSHKNMLEVEAQKFSSYVNDYMADVKGYQFHAFESTFSFTNDFNALKETPQYSAWLTKINEYQDDYIQAKTNLNNFEGVYQGAKANHTLSYDQSEMYLALNNEIVSCMNGIHYSALNNEINKLEQKQGGIKSSIGNSLNNTENQLKADLAQLKKDGGSQSEISALKKAYSGISSLKKTIDQDLKAGTPISGVASQIKSILSEVKLEPNSIGSAIKGDFGSLKVELKGYNTTATSLGTTKTTLKTNLNNFLTTVKGLINEQISKITAQNQKYGSTLSVTLSGQSINPFAGILDNLDSFRSSIVQDSRSPTSLSGLWSNIKNTKGLMTKAVSAICTPSTMATYKKELSKWTSTQTSYQDYKNVLTSTLNTYNENNHCPVPAGERYSGFSAYGRAMKNLDSYRKVMADIEGLTPAFDQFSRIASKKPKLVNPAAMIQDWANYESDKSNLSKLKIERDVAYGVLAAAILESGLTCGVGTDPLIIATATIASLNSKINNEEKNTIPGALDLYGSTKNALTQQQLGYDNKWKRKLSQVGEVVSMQVEKDIANTVLAKNQSGKQMTQQESNEEKVMKTANAVAANKPKAVKTSSFIG